MCVSLSTSEGTRVGGWADPPLSCVKGLTQEKTDWTWEEPQVSLTLQMPPAGVQGPGRYTSAQINPLSSNPYHLLPKLKHQIASAFSSCLPAMQPRPPGKTQM